MILSAIRWLVLSSFFFCFKQKTAYEMRISDWSSDVCSSDLAGGAERAGGGGNTDPGVVHRPLRRRAGGAAAGQPRLRPAARADRPGPCVQIGRASCRERVCQYG